MDRGDWWDRVHEVVRVGHDLVTKPPPPLPTKPSPESFPHLDFDLKIQRSILSKGIKGWLSHKGLEGSCTLKKGPLVAISVTSRKFDLSTLPLSSPLEVLLQALAAHRWGLYLDQLFRDCQGLWYNFPLSLLPSCLSECTFIGSHSIEAFPGPKTEECAINSSSLCWYNIFFFSCGDV